MSELAAQIEQLRHRFATRIAESAPSDWEELRNVFLGRKGELAALFDQLGKAPADERKQLGKLLNDVKNELTVQIETLRASAQPVSTSTRLDPTLPGRPYPAGRMHPLTSTMNRIVELFGKMGFIVEEGPELETAWFNFDALNTPPWHPARAKTDTLYLNPGFGDRELLRTETSPVQIHALERRGVPIRMISPGRVYRNDKPDATHSPAFHQVEGLCVDVGVSMSDLKGTLLAFYRALLGNDVNIRFRPHFFPFTEPSAEVDVTCIFCRGKGCRTCKGSGFIEMGGSGMVHPNVLEGVGIDSEKYTGFAFGLGIERLAIQLHGIDDIRLFYENDLRMLNQF